VWNALSNNINTSLTLLLVLFPWRATFASPTERHFLLCNNAPDPRWEAAVAAERGRGNTTRSARTPQPPDTEVMQERQPRSDADSVELEMQATSEPSHQVSPHQLHERVLP